MTLGREKRPTIWERLAQAKRECGERKPLNKVHQKKPPEHDLRAGAGSGGWNRLSSWVRTAAASTVRAAKAAPTPASRASGWFSSPAPITSPHARKVWEYGLKTGGKTACGGFSCRDNTIFHVEWQSVSA